MTEKIWVSRLWKQEYFNTIPFQYRGWFKIEIPKVLVYNTDLNIAQTKLLVLLQFDIVKS